MNSNDDTNDRSAVFLFKDIYILLIKRIRNGELYYVFPGGHVKFGEDPESAATRELYEESGTKARNLVKVFESYTPFNDVRRRYYAGEWIEGEPMLVGEELEKNRPENSYEPLWIEISEVKNLPISPDFMKNWVGENINEIYKIAMKA